MIKNKRLESIDLLKGVAILLVILCHSRQLFPNLSHTFDILMFGQMACQLFFVISGYTSCVSYFKNKKHQKFFLKRLFSILPAYYLTGILAISLGILSVHLIGRNIGPGGNTNPLAILSNLLFLNGLIPIGNNNVVGGGWFIGTLVLLYLLFPLFIKLFRVAKKNKKYIPFIASAAQIITILLIYFISNRNPVILQNNGFVYFNIVNQLSCYLFGILAYYELNSNKKPNPLMDLIKCSALTLLGIGLFYGQFKFAFIIITNIIGLASYYLLKAFVNYEKIAQIKNTKLKYFLCLSGKESLYLFLSHPFFAYTLNAIIIKIWQTKFSCANVTIVYLLSLPIVIICSFLLAKLLEAICSPISKKMVKYIERS